MRSETMVFDPADSRSYVETTKRPLESSAGAPRARGCPQSVALFVASNHARHFAKVFSKAATDTWPNNTLEQIDWSLQGRYLLARLSRSDFESEKISILTLVFDSASGSLFWPDTLKLFQHHFGRRCAMDVTVEGFTSDDEVAITAKPQEPDLIYESQQLPSCTATATAWAINFRRNELRRLPEGYEPVRYGHLTP